MLTAEKSSASLVVSALLQQRIPHHPAALQSLWGMCQPTAWWLGSRRAARQGMLPLEHPEHQEPSSQGVWHPGEGCGSREGSSRDGAVTAAGGALCHKHPAWQSSPMAGSPQGSVRSFSPDHSQLPNGQEAKLRPLQAPQHLPVQELLSEDSTGLTPPT